MQKALSFFVTVYRTLAEWRAVVARLDGFEMSVATRRDSADAERDSIESARPAAAARSTCEKLLVRLPNGTPLVAADGFAHPPPASACW